MKKKLLQFFNRIFVSVKEEECKKKQKRIKKNSNERITVETNKIKYINEEGKK